MNSHPADIVSPKPFDPEAVLAVILAEGQTVTFRTNPEVVEDSDGRVIGVTPGATSTATFGRAHFTGEQWEAIARHLINKHENKENQK